MKAKAPFALLLGAYLLVLSSPASAQKLKLGSAVKVNPMFFLPVLAAEEKGFWKENGLEVEWVPFDAGPPMFRAVAAKELFLAMDVGINSILSASRGVPVKIIAELDKFEGFFVYLLAKNPIREPKDLKGTRIGVPTLGSASHAYGEIMAKFLGLEKEVKFVGAGGAGPMVAALKAGAVGALIHTFVLMTELKIKGEVRDLLALDDYLPKPWLSRVVLAHKEFIKEKPEITRRTVRAILQANRFWKKDSGWAIARIKATVGWSEEAAREFYKISQPSEDGRLERKAVENVRAFLIEYNLIAREKAPPVDELYTDEFVRPR